ncbi:acyltransferase family protein [Pseudonocardia nigra]|uniref:acyltransferase family protein n=1 Tax=Pseudonocardia nigra TaxID=1921578 RepID=UPI001C5CE8C1|nr:acyltransferase [Pseudonocardia nigra]
MTALRARTTPSGHQAATSGEFRGLTGLRIVAAVWVVLFHFHFTPLPGVAEAVGVLGPLITSGALGVDLFFVLSGFVIAHTYLDQLGPAFRAGATARFLWARVCRMWPVYALVFHLFGLWLVARLVFGSDPEIAFQAVQPGVDAGQYVQQLFLVQLWDDPFLDGASWVGPTWSISAEWLAYLLFPVAALVFFRLRNLPIAVLGAAALALMTPIAWAYLSTGSPYYPWSWLVRILCGFGGGVLMYLAVRRLRSTGGVRRTASWLAVAVPVLIAAGLLLGELVAPGRGGAVIVLFPLLVAALALADRGPAMVLSAPWAVYGGRISYSLYLVHIPIFEVYWLALRRFAWLRLESLLAHVVGVLVVLSTLVVAAVAYRWVEEPARSRMRAMAPVAALRALVARLRPRRVPAATVPPTVARFAAQRQALADLAAADTSAPAPLPRHAASPFRPATLAAALINAQRRRPAHRAEMWAAYERAEYVRGGYLHAGN